MIEEIMKHAPEAKSKTIRDGVIDWFQNTLESRTNSPDTPIIVIMQRLHEEDLAGWLLDGGNGEEWEHLCLSAIQDDGSALWPEKHSIERLRIMEDASPYVFAGQYQQRPAPPAGGFFKPDRIEIVDAIPTNIIKECRAWDLAATENEGDYTAGPKLAKPSRQIPQKKNWLLRILAGKQQLSQKRLNKLKLVFRNLMMLSVKCWTK